MAVAKGKNRDLFLKLKITSDCSERCIHCDYSRLYSTTKDYLSSSLVDQILVEIQDWTFDGKLFVLITGGEPANHPDCIQILKRLSQAQPAHSQFATNGLRLSRDTKFFKEVMKFPPLEFLFSIESSLEQHKQLRGSVESFHASFQLAERLSKWNPKPLVSATMLVYKNNQTEIWPAISNLKKEKVDLLRLIRFDPFSAISNHQILSRIENDQWESLKQQVMRHNQELSRSEHPLPIVCLTRNDAPTDGIDFIEIDPLGHVYVRESEAIKPLIERLARHNKMKLAYRVT